MSQSSRPLNRIVIPGLVGNILEWYDFALYGYFAAIISPLFFPSDNQTLSLITTFAVFAIGFIMRPLGAIIFGHFGDRFGRKNALASAILLMAIPTTIMGCLPTYHQIGIAAPLLLILCRLLQGLAVGGEYTGSIVYILEHAPKERRGFFGSLAMSSAFLGLLLGSLVAFLVGLFDHSTTAWLWRLPFIASLLLGGVGLYLRLGMPESPIFEAMSEQGEAVKSPMKLAFSQYLKPMLVGTGLVMLPSAGFYMSFVYLSTYLNVFLDVSLQHALLNNTIAMLVILFVIPLCGHLSDKIGRRNVLMMGAVGFLCLSYPAFALLNHGTVWSIFLAQVIFALLVSMSYSAVPAALVELFPAKVRYTGMSFPYNAANALCGGTAPLVATSVIHFSGSLYAPSVYLALLALFTLGVASGFFTETRGRNLSADLCL